MANHPLLRTALFILLTVSFGRAALGAEDIPTPSNAAQYKRADGKFYAHGDVLKADPAAVILPPTAFAQNGDTYTYTPQKKAPKIIFAEVPNDWIEPITPPDMAPLNIAPDVMQIREPHGDVEVAQPNAPTTFSPAADGQPIANGSVVKTGANSTAAILFGGVDSARLMPDSEAAVQQAVASTSRAAEVDLTAGGVFSKVGTQVGVQGDYQIHTPYGTVLAQGGDFATLTQSGRIDIWVSQGKVDLLEPDGKKYASTSADGTGPLKLIRCPAISGHSLETDADSLSAVLAFIPMANQKLAALHQKAAAGVPLTANEQAYLQRIKQVPALIKLEIVVPPPSQLTVLADGTVGFQGSPLSLVELTNKLKDFVASSYAPAVVVMAGTGATYANFEAALKACKDAGVPHVTTEGPVPAPPPPPPAPPKPLDVVVGPNGAIKLNGAVMKFDDFTAKIKAAVAATPEIPVTVHADPKASYVDLTAVINACQGAPAKNFNVVYSPAKEFTVTVHGDSTILFHGETLGIDEFRADIKAAVLLQNDLPIVIHSNPKADYAKFNAVVEACKDTGAKQVTLVPPTPQPPPPPAPPKLDVIVQADGQVKFQGALMSPADFTDKIKDAVATTPDAPVTVHPDPKADYVSLAAVANAVSNSGAKTFNVLFPSMKELAVIVHADGSIQFHGAKMNLDEFTQEIKAAITLQPNLPIVVHSNPKMDYTKFEAVVDACKATGAKEVTLVPPTPQPAPPVAATPPAPVVPPPAPTPPAPAPAPKPAAPPEPLTVIAHADGSIKFQGKTMKIDEFTAKIKAAAAANPALSVIIHSNPKMDYAKFEAVVDACKNAPATEVDVVPPAPQPPAPAPVVSSTPPVAATPPPAPKPAPAPVNTKAVPAEIDLAADGTLKLDGATVTEDDLKIKLADLKATNPKNPLVMMKQPGVTKEQWMHYVDLCHSMGLKLLVKNAKAPTLAPLVATPPSLRPSAAEGGPTIEPPPGPAAAPETETPSTNAPPVVAATDDAVPVEIELTPDGQVSFLGEAVSDSELKARLKSVAQANTKEPVLIVKDEKVSHEQWQHVVDLCHAANLKVKLKTVKSSDSGALKPHAHLPVVLAPPAATGSGGEKILPVEIGLQSKGRLTFEGAPVTLDELKARLATVAQGNPDQPIVIMKNSDVSDDSADALVTVCQGVSAQLRISVKTAPDFTPTLPDNAPTQNLPAPNVHLHASMDALDGESATASNR